MLGAPFDSSGAGRGEERAPGALRAAGLPAAFGTVDAGDVAPPLRSPVRDPATGIVAFADLCASSQILRRAVAATLAGGDRPLVLGGDCTLLLGTMAGVRDTVGRVGLWFVDGHADYLDGRSSPTGEAADMELAILTEHGPPGLADLAGQAPLMEAADIVILGHRPACLDPDVALELERVPATIARMSADEITAAGPAGGRRLGARAGRSRAGVAPCRPRRPRRDRVAGGVLPAAARPGLGGVRGTGATVAGLGCPGRCLSVADFNPDLDADGAHARRVADAFARALQ